MALERRSFQMDDQLLIDVIKRQAGSLWKAISEAVMNAVDAGASKCDITLSRNTLTIQDNGKGFRSREDIEKYFEVFGKPHDAKEAKTFGRFRMGRGQLFAFGANSWRSNAFEMSVDIDKDGLDYHLYSDRPHVDGCTITVQLYKQLTHTEFARIVEDIRASGKYIEIPATLNGKVFPKDRSKVQWDMELEQADILFKSNQDLRVYNQGILVRSYYRHHYGAGGDVVTKVPLQVNFARNDIMDSCPVWAYLVRKITQHANAAATSTRTQRRQRSTTYRSRNYTPRPRLIEEDRRRLINQAKDGELSGNAFKGAQVWTRYSKPGHVTLRTIAKECGGKVTVPPTSSQWKHRRLISEIEEISLACVLDHCVLARFGMSGDEIIEFANKLARDGRYRLTYVAWDSLVETLETTSTIIPDDELTPLELTVLEVLRDAKGMLLQGAGCPVVGTPPRNIYIGRSRRAAWTDGRTMIGLSRDLIARHGADLEAWLRYAYHLRHETLHKTRSDKEHEHDEKFLLQSELWSKATVSLAAYLNRCMIMLPRIAENVGARLDAQALNELDKAERAQEAAESRPGFTGEDSETPQAQPI